MCETRRSRVASNAGSFHFPIVEIDIPKLAKKHIRNLVFEFFVLFSLPIYRTLLVPLVRVRVTASIFRSSRLTGAVLLRWKYRASAVKKVQHLFISRRKKIE